MSGTCVRLCSDESAGSHGLVDFSAMRRLAAAVLGATIRHLNLAKNTCQDFVR